MSYEWTETTGASRRRMAESPSRFSREQVVHAMKRAALQTDICARHGMRKVDVVRGKWKGWRCRRG